jgi:hypothetical protein
LGQTDFCQDDLTNGHIPAGKLPNSHQERPGKLGQGREADNELAETKEQTNPELSHGDNPECELADGDDTFSHLKFPLGIFTESYVNQWLAIKGQV